MKKNIIIIILAVLVLCLGGYIVYDKVLIKDDVEQKNDNEVSNDDNIVKEDLYGTYSWNKSYVNEYGNNMNLKVTLVINSDGTATYEESDGYSYESTKGSYVYDDDKIIYTKEYYNYEGQNNDLYNEEDKTETFIVVDASTLKNTYRDQEVSLKK